MKTILKIVSILKSIVYTPPILILLLYRLKIDPSFIKKVKDAMLTGDIHIFDEDEYFFNQETDNWSDRVLHTISIFWLTILFLIIVLW